MPVVLPLHGDRLTLRAFTLADAPAMQALYDDPEVMRYIDTRGEDPATWVSQYVTAQRRRGYAFWAVQERAGGALIGEAGFAPWTADGVAEPGTLELGYLLRRDRWGRGLATEAAALCLAAAFGPLGARRVTAVADVGNDASLRVLAKTGFAPVGRRRHHGRDQHVLHALAPPGRPA